MFDGLGGWHLLVILGMIIVPLAVVAGVVYLVIVLARRSSAAQQPAVAGYPTQSAQQSAPQPSSADLLAARLDELKDLAARGVISDSEYEAKRAEILGEI